MLNPILGRDFEKDLIWSE